MYNLLKTTLQVVENFFFNHILGAQLVVQFWADISLLQQLEHKVSLHVINTINIIYTSLIINIINTTY